MITLNAFKTAAGLTVVAASVFNEGWHMPAYGIMALVFVGVFFALVKAE